MWRNCIVMNKYAMMQECFRIAGNMSKDFYDLSDEEQSKIMDEAYDNVIFAEAERAESLCGGDR